MDFELFVVDYFGTTPTNVHVILLALHSGFMTGRFKGPYGMQILTWIGYKMQMPYLLYCFSSPKGFEHLRYITPRLCPVPSSSSIKLLSRTILLEVIFGPPEHYLRKKNLSIKKKSFSNV